MSVVSLCQRLEMSRQNYCRGEQHQGRREVQGEDLADFTREVRQRHPRMGCLKIWTLFGQQHPEQAEGLGRDRAFEELRSGACWCGARKASKREPPVRGTI